MTDSFYAGGGIGLGPRPAVPEPKSYPAPEVTSRDGVQGPAKTAVAGLVKLAERFGWDCRITYARGYIQHARTGEPGTQPRGSLAVRMRRESGYAVAVYVDHGASWSWDTLWRLGEHPKPYDRVGLFMDAVLGPVHLIAPLPPLHTTAPWHAPWIYPATTPWSS